MADKQPNWRYRLSQFIIIMKLLKLARHLTRPNKEENKRDSLVIEEGP